MMLMVDLVNFEFIMTTLDIFNFGEKFKEWIKFLLGMNEDANFQAVTIVNGNLLKRLNVDQCRVK